MNPGLMDEEKNFLSEAIATLSAEIAYHVFRFGNLLNIVWGDDGNN